MNRNAVPKCRREVVQGCVCVAFDRVCVADSGGLVAADFCSVSKMKNTTEVGLVCSTICVCTLFKAIGGKTFKNKHDIGVI